MKIALCLRGFTRSLAVLPSFDALKIHAEVDVYMHTYDIISNPDIETYHSGNFGYQTSNTIDIKDIQSKFSTSLKKIYVESYSETLKSIDHLSETFFENWLTINEFGNPFTKSTISRRIISQLLSAKKSVDLITEDDYDLVIVTRPDVQFSINFNQLKVLNNSVSIAGNFKFQRDFDNFGKYQGVWCDDLIRVGNLPTIKKIMNVCSDIPFLLGDLEKKNYFEIAFDCHKIQSYCIELSDVEVLADTSVVANIIR